jgi:TRAP-type transport system small permease protein
MLTLNRYVAVIVFAALTMVVGLQVLDRLVLHQSFIWSEEVARFLFFWVVLLGAAMSVHTRRHFVLDITKRRGRGPRGVAGLILDLIPHVCVCVFSAFLLWQGIDYVRAGFLRTATNSDLNMGVVYAAIPAFAALSVLYSGRNMLTDYRTFREGRRVDVPVLPAE